MPVLSKPATLNKWNEQHAMGLLALSSTRHTTSVSRKTSAIDSGNVMVSLYTYILDTNVRVLLLLMLFVLHKRSFDLKVYDTAMVDCIGGVSELLQ